MRLAESEEVGELCEGWVTGASQDMMRCSVGSVSGSASVVSFPPSSGLGFTFVRLLNQAGFWCGCPLRECS